MTAGPDGHTGAITPGMPARTLAGIAARAAGRTPAVTHRTSRTTVGA